MRCLWLLVVLVGCQREAVVKDDPPPKKKSASARPRPLLERYPLRPHILFVSREDTDGTIKRTKSEEICKRDGDDPPTWLCLHRELEGDKFESTTRYRLTRDGFVYDALITNDGTTLDIVPPKVALPPEPRAGAKWSASHTNNNKKQERSCEVERYDACDDGILVKCVTKYENGRVIDVENRYCGGVGYVGGVGTVKQPDGKTITTTDEDVRAAP